MDIRKVKKLIELLEESQVAEIEIHEGEESVRISRYAQGAPAAPAPAAVVAPAPAPAPHASEEGAPVALDPDAERFVRDIVADEPVSTAAVFTRNRVKAAPVQLSQQRVERGRAQAIVVERPFPEMRSSPVRCA